MFLHYWFKWCRRVFELYSTSNKQLKARISIMFSASINARLKKCIHLFCYPDQKLCNQAAHDKYVNCYSLCFNCKCWPEILFSKSYLKKIIHIKLAKQIGTSLSIHTTTKKPVSTSKWSPSIYFVFPCFPYEYFCIGEQKMKGRTMCRTVFILLTDWANI